MRWCLSLGMIAFAVPSTSEGCCSACISTVQSLTFRQEAKQATARAIVCGTIANPRKVGDAAFTDFTIESAIRADPAMKGKTSLVLERYLPVENKNAPPRLVLFCDIYEQGVDPYRGFVVQRAASVEYVKKAIALDSSDPVRNLVFFFQYIDDPDPEVARDAYKELSLTADFDIGAAGRKLDAVKIRKRLQDPKTPISHLAIYAKLLAAAGMTKDAPLLAAILQRADPKEAHVQVSEILVAYVMLAPKVGWDYTTAILADPAKDFSRRYAASKAVRYLQQSRTGVVSNRQIISAYRLLLSQEDIADVAIEDLRAWERWELADEILELAKTEAHKIPIVRRAMLRYALRCKGNAAADAYVVAKRKVDPEAVTDAQELLDLLAAHEKQSAELENQ